MYSEREVVLPGGGEARGESFARVDHAGRRDRLDARGFRDARSEIVVAPHDRIESAEHRTGMERDADLARVGQSQRGPVRRAHALQEAHGEVRAVLRRVEHDVERVAPRARHQRLRARSVDLAGRDLPEALLKQRRHRVVQAAEAGEVREQQHLERASRSLFRGRDRNRFALRSDTHRGRRSRCVARERLRRRCRDTSDLAQIDGLRAADALLPPFERCVRAAQASLGNRIDHAQQRRRRLELRRAQAREPFEEDGGMIEQHVVAEMVFLGRHDHPCGALESCVEPPHPIFAGDRHARANEIAALERQHDVDFRARIDGSLDEDQVGAAGRRRIDDGVMEARDALPHDCFQRGNERGRKPRSGAVRRIDHMPCEGDHIRYGQHGQDVARFRKRTGEQRDLTAHRRDTACVACGGEVGGGIGLTRLLEPTEQQLGLARRRHVPEVAGLVRGEPHDDFFREALRVRAIAENPRQRRCVDARERIVPQRIRREIFLARALRQRDRTRTVGRAMISVFPEPAAQAEDIAQPIGRGRRGLRALEERMRRMDGARARMGEGAPVEEFCVSRTGLDRLTERIARVPRRALLEMPANALGRFRGRCIRADGTAVHAGPIALARGHQCCFFCSSAIESRNLVVLRS